ncbi:MAG: hypothetical protein AABW48_05455 [Nanoarchaeota archaeon]
MSDAVYILQRKPIDKGSVQQVLDPGSLNPRPVQSLEAVLVVDARKGAGYGQIPSGQPVYVIGARETETPEPLSVWRTGFVDHPEHYSLCTSAHASKFIPLAAYQRMMENIKNGDDIIELKNFINKFYGTAC